MDNTERIRRIRSRAAAHQEQLEAETWATAADLAARWRQSIASVYRIPRALLPYKEFGSGTKRVRRRYSPAAIAAFEKSDARATKSA